MKHLILMGGDLASGKSEYSRRIGKELGVPVVNKDILKEILGDKFTAVTREENLKLSQAAFDIICYLLKTSADIIIESNFKQHEMDVLARLARQRDYGVLSLRFAGDDAVLQARFLDRLTGDRHYVHKSQDFADMTAFSGALAELRSVRYIGKVIEINSTTFDYADDDGLRREIHNFLMS